MKKYDWRYHVALGLHSGFPLCCVLFFCIVWLPLPKRSRLANWYRRAEGHGAGYVRCPLCVLINRFVPVRHCNCVWGCEKAGYVATLDCPKGETEAKYTEANEDAPYPEGTGSYEWQEGPTGIWGWARVSTGAYGYIPVPHKGVSTQKYRGRASMGRIMATVPPSEIMRKLQEAYAILPPQEGHDGSSEGEAGSTKREARTAKEIGG